MFIIVYVFFLGGWLLVNYKRNGFNSGSFLISIYFLSSLLGSYLVFFHNYYDVERIKWYPILYHIICLFLFLSPLVYYSNRIGLKYRFPSDEVLRIFTLICIFTCSATLISSIPKIKSLMSLGDFSLARNMYNYGLLNDNGGGGLINYIGVIGTAFSIFSLLLFFHYLRISPKRYLLIIILLICSFSDAIYSFASAVGRGGVMRWILMFMYLFFLFKSTIPKRTVRRVGFFVSVVSAPLLLVFIWITISRFSGRDLPIMYYVFDYLGQSFIYFSYNFDQFFDSTFGGRLSFPFLFMDGMKVDRDISNEVYTDYNLNTFATFVGTFYKDMGFVRTLLLALFYYFSSIWLFKYSNNCNNFIRLCYFIIFSAIVINGVFYYQYTGTTTMRTFILILAFSYITTWLYSGKNLVFKK